MSVTFKWFCKNNVYMCVCTLESEKAYDNVKIVNLKERY